MNGALKDVRPIANHIICGAGFSQTEGQWDQGMPAVCRLLHRRYAGPDLMVHFFRWDEDWNAKADWLFGCAGGPIARILSVDYSWSVGNGFVQLANRLKDRGQFIERAIFSDGVFHWGGNIMHKIGLAQVIACLPRPWGRPQVKIPNNVGKVDWFVQSKKNFHWTKPNTWLRGHEIIDESGYEVAGRVDIEGVIHHWMDEGELFQNRVLQVAEEMFGSNNS